MEQIHGQVVTVRARTPLPKDHRHPFHLCDITPFPVGKGVIGWQDQNAGLIAQKHPAKLASSWAGGRINT